MNAESDAEPIWIEARQLRSFHYMLVDRFGGSHGVKDKAALEMALNRPRNKYSYEASSLYELAAAYAFGIIKNHPFNDGNKRAAATAVAVFLQLNGVYFRAEESALVLMMEGVTKNTLEENTLAVWIKENAQVERKE